MNEIKFPEEEAIKKMLASQTMEAPIKKNEKERLEMEEPHSINKILDVDEKYYNKYLVSSKEKKEALVRVLITEEQYNQMQDIIISSQRKFKNKKLSITSLVSNLVTEHLSKHFHRNNS